MENETSQKSRKKEYLVPLIVLFLCFASLTGVAYAYTSIFEDDDEITVKSYILNLDGSTTVDLSDCVLEYDSVVTKGATTYELHDFEKTITVKIANANNTTQFRITSLTITSDDAPSGITFNITSPSFNKETNVGSAVSETTIVITATGSTTETPSETCTINISIGSVAV